MQNKAYVLRKGICMRLIVARHGETEWNVQNKVLGRTDIPLNEKGRRQANLLAENIKKYKVKNIYVSPLMRAHETGKIVASYCDANLIVKNVLIEQDFGIFEGVDRDDINYQIAKRELVKKYLGGESFFDVAARVYPFIEEIKECDDDVMIITHGGICRIINAFFEPMDNEEFVLFTMPNCGYKVYEI